MMPETGPESVAMPLFSVQNLKVDFLTANGPVRAVDGVDFTMLQSFPGAQIDVFQMNPREKPWDNK